MTSKYSWKNAGVEKKKQPSFFVNLALVILSTLLALLISEAALRSLGHAPMYVSPERDRFWKYDALLGWTHRPGQQGTFTTPQFQTTVSINSHGLRDREYSYERLQGTGRILILGDSFAWGYGVEESQRFSELLEANLDVEVINGGVSGYSTDQELIWYGNEGIKYSPDLVVLVLAGNDIGDNSRDLVSTIYYKPVFSLENGQLVQMNTPVPVTSPPGKLIYGFSQRSALFYFLVQRYFDLLHISGDHDSVSSKQDQAQPDASSGEKPFELTVALLAEIRDLAASMDARFLIVATDSWWNGPKGWTYADFLDELKAQGFVVLDVPSASGYQPGRMLIPDDGHWNPEGHEFVAELLSAYIKADTLLIHAENQVDESSGQ